MPVKFAFFPKYKCYFHSSHSGASMCTERGLPPNKSVIKVFRVSWLLNTNQSVINLTATKFAPEDCPIFSGSPLARCPSQIHLKKKKKKQLHRECIINVLMHTNFFSYKTKIICANTILAALVHCPYAQECVRMSRQTLHIQPPCEATELRKHTCIPPESAEFYNI